MSKPFTSKFWVLSLRTFLGPFSLLSILPHGVTQSLFVCLQRQNVVEIPVWKSQMRSRVVNPIPFYNQHLILTFIIKVDINHVEMNMNR